MNLNLVLNIDNFRWNDINVDRSDCIDSFSEVIVTLIDFEDVCWQHPEAYTLYYEWGCVHEMFLNEEFETIKRKVEWIKYRHFKTILKLWREVALNQNDPFCGSIGELNKYHKRKLNGILGCSNTLGISEFVDTPASRHQLVIYYCQNDPSLIKWEDRHRFLPNLEYSNEFLAEQMGSLSTDSVERKKQISERAKEFCDGGCNKLFGNRSKEAVADEVGSEVARRNFYTYEQELTRKEEKLRSGSMRKIFSLVKENHKIYLSIDFEKGNCFELCDHSGAHRGEYRFDGIPTNHPVKVDASGKHDIWAISKK